MGLFQGDEDLVITFKNRPDLIKQLRDIFPEIKNHTALKFKRVRCSVNELDYEVLRDQFYDVRPEIRIHWGVGRLFKKPCKIRMVWNFFEVDLAETRYGNGNGYNGTLKVRER